MLAVPKHPQLWRELLAIRYETEGGVVKLEKNKDIARRLGCFPDYADAAMSGEHVREPLPMEDKPEVDLENTHDRATPLNLNGEGTHCLRQGLMTRQEDLNSVFEVEARTQWREQRYPDGRGHGERLPERGTTGLVMMTVMPMKTVKTNAQRSAACGRLRSWSGAVTVSRRFKTVAR